VWGNRDSPATSDTHAGDPLVPAGDDLADTEGEIKRRTTIPRRVEFRARAPAHTDIVDRDLATADSFGPIADHMILDNEVGRSIGCRNRHHWAFMNIYWNIYWIAHRVEGTTDSAAVVEIQLGILTAGQRN